MNSAISVILITKSENSMPLIHQLTIHERGTSMVPHSFVALPPLIFPGIQSFNQPPPVQIAIGNLLPNLPEIQKPPGMGMIGGTVKSFLKNELPPSTKVIGVAVSAGIAANKLAHNIQTALDGGQSPAEAYICQTSKTITEELSGKVLKGAIVGGIPPYFAAAASSPPLAATIPVIVPLIPQAYQGAQTTSKIVGEATEAICHHGFDRARQLNKKSD
jgi:hypothetical protein